MRSARDLTISQKTKRINVTFANHNHAPFARIFPNSWYSAFWIRNKLVNQQEANSVITKWSYVVYINHAMFHLICNVLAARASQALLCNKIIKRKRLGSQELAKKHCSRKQWEHAEKALNLLVGVRGALVERHTVKEGSMIFFSVSYENHFTKKEDLNMGLQITSQAL